MTSRHASPVSVGKTHSFNYVLQLLQFQMYTLIRMAYGKLQFFHATASHLTIQTEQAAKQMCASTGTI